MTKSNSSSVTTNFVQNLIEGERENEEEDKDSITQEELFAMVQQFRKGKGKGKSKGKGKGVCWNCGDGDHLQQRLPERQAGQLDRNNVVERPTRLKNQQRFKQRMGHRKRQLEQCQRQRERVATRTENGARHRASVEARVKEALYSVDGIAESDGWTQSDVAKFEEDPHSFCIMEHSQDVVTDDITNRVGATGAVKLGDEHERRNGHFKNFFNKQRQESLYSSTQQVPDAWYIGI